MNWQVDAMFTRADIGYKNRNLKLQPLFCSDVPKEPMPEPIEDMPGPMKETPTSRFRFSTLVPSLCRVVLELDD